MKNLLKKSFVKKILIAVLALVGFYLVAGVTTFFLEPTSPVQNVFVTNVTDGAATVTWTTAKPTKGAVTINQWFPLPVFIGLNKDDGDKNLSRQNFYTTHHATISNLQPQKTYKYKIYQGAKPMYQGSLKTGPTPESIGTPNPIYGKVITSDQKPVVGAIVYFRAAGPDGVKSALLSTLTNLQGGWTIDLSSLRSADLTKPFTITKDSTEEIVVEAGSRGRAKSQSTPGKDKPWPDVFLKVAP